MSKIILPILLNNLKKKKRTVDSKTLQYMKKKIMKYFAFENFYQGKTLKFNHRLVYRMNEYVSVSVRTSHVYEKAWLE